MLFFKKKKKKIDVMLTAFRDGFQSVYGARVLTRDFLPALPAAVDAGITHFEAGGGARFQSLFFYCNENAFDMMDSFREAVGPDVNLQTLARGVNVVGLDSQSSDIINLHAQLFKKHGMTTIRNFDALNDVDNLDFSGRCIVDAGLKHEISITMMGLPVGLTGAHDPEFYLRVLQDIMDAEIPFHSLCFKDASGTASPNTVFETIKKARSRIPGSIPIRFHTHETAGLGTTTTMAALEAGATGIDLSMDPCSGGTGQPDIIVMWHALEGSEFDLGLDIKKLVRAEKTFKEAMSEYVDLPEASRVEPMIFDSPMPGGALTANTQMMRDNGILDRYPEVIENMAEVVKRGGFGTSVTPVSQFYFQQAFNNTMAGPWAKIAEGYGKMVLGYFGKTPVSPDPEIVSLAEKQLGLEPTTQSPRLLNDRNPSKGVAPAEVMLQENGLPVTPENVFIASTCKEKGIIFLNGDAVENVRKKTTDNSKDKKRDYPDGIPAKPEDIRGFDVYVDGEYFKVEVNDPRVHSQAVFKDSFPDSIHRNSALHTSTDNFRIDTADPSYVQTKKGEIAVSAPLPGILLRYEKKVKDRVKAGETIAVIEAMKMNNNIYSPCDGDVVKILIKPGKSMDKGSVLCIIKTA
jgi:pyruvate carboxylase subunit B